MTIPLKYSIIMGSLCAAVGLVAGLFVSIIATGEGYRLFPVFAAAAAFFTSAISWYAIAGNQKRSFLLLRGTIAGAVSGLISHPVCWYLQIIALNICYWLFGTCKSSLGEPPVNLVHGIWHSLVLSAFSLLFMGWYTILLGSAIGFALARRFRQGVLQNRIEV